MIKKKISRFLLCFIFSVHVLPLAKVSTKAAAAKEEEATAKETETEKMTTKLQSSIPTQLSIV